MRDQLKAYQEAEWRGAPANDLKAMRDGITAQMREQGNLTDTQAQFRFWRTLADVRDNDL